MVPPNLERPAQKAGLSVFVLRERKSNTWVSLLFPLSCSQCYQRWLNCRSQILIGYLMRNGSAKIPRLREFYLQPKHSGWYLSKPHSSSHPGSLPWNPELIRDFFHKEI